MLTLVYGRTLMTTRKVSALVPTTEHRQLLQLAKKHKTTVGQLVAFGARLSVAFLQSEGATPNIPLDRRRKGA
jgi:hypothetical protein